MRRNLLVTSGCLLVALGAAGIVLPLLPTTPFLLLAAYCFARSSARLHEWLLKHRRLGPYIHAFRNRTGLTRAQKVRIVASFTTLMGVSFYFAPQTALRALLVGIWLFWTIMLVRMKTLPQPATAPLPTPDDQPAQ